MADDDRYEQLTRALADVDEARFEKLVAEILANTPSPETIDCTFQAVQAGMEAVGKRFQEGEYFLAEMLFAADMVNGLMPKVSPYLEKSGRKKRAKIILGTASGDIHDIGKNLVAVLLTAAEFEVIDLGTDVAPDRFVEAIRTHQPQIIGISGLLTLSIEPMRETVAAIRDAGLRDQVKVIIGGNPITEQIHHEVGSDAWVNNAAEGVDQCRAWVEA